MKGSFHTNSSRVLTSTMLLRFHIFCTEMNHYNIVPLPSLIRAAASIASYGVL